MTKLALLVAAAFFMEFLDASILTTALPRMAETMKVAAVDLNIGVSIYSLMIAVFILPSSWLVNRFGARVIFTSAIILFTLSSILCGFANSPVFFIAARALQGLGGALMVPVGRLLVLRTTPKPGILRAIAILTWPSLTAPLIGPPLGGYLADYFSWRAIFFVNVPLGIIGALLALRWIPKLEMEPAKPFDTVGFLLAGGALGAALMGLDQLAANDGALRALGLGAFAALCAWGFARRLATHPHPIVDARPLAYPTFRLSLTGGTLARTLISAVPFLLPLMFELGLGRDALSAGLTLTPLFLGNIGIKPFTTPILRFCGFRGVLIVNAGIQAATMFACALISPATPPVLIVVLLAVSGASRSMHFTALNSLPFSDVAPQEMSMASLIFSASFQAGLAFGIGLAAALIKIGAIVAPNPELSRFHFAFVGLGVLMLVAMANHARLARDAGVSVLGAKAAR